jgi:parallel beta-helix repeat protein
VAGAAKTTIAYGETANVNEAVVTFQRCSNSTQLLGFTVDGRGTARRGILVNSNSNPALADLVILGAEYGVASHRGSVPYLIRCRISGSLTAGLFIQGGSADVRECEFVGGERVGVYVRGALDPIVLRNVTMSNNGQVGMQVSEADFVLDGARIADNGDSGLILQDATPEIHNITVENHANVGIVMEACWGVLSGCTVRNNEYGMVVSIEGEPEIFNCTFQNNVSYHIGVEGDANPVIGGSLEHANTFLGQPSYLIQSSSTSRVVATHNFWDQPCSPKESFQNTGSGRLIRKPWASGNLLRAFEECELSRKYHNKWVNGKLDENGNPIGRDDDLVGAAAPAGAGR